MKKTFKNYVETEEKNFAKYKVAAEKIKKIVKKIRDKGWLDLDSVLEILTKDELEIAIKFGNIIGTSKETAIKNLGANEKDLEKASGGVIYTIPGQKK